LKAKSFHPLSDVHADFYVIYLIVQ